MKRFDESVPRQLGEILIKHGRSPLTDAKLCENLLKDSRVGQDGTLRLWNTDRF